MLPNKIAFVDIETTGMRLSFDRIIEIGIIRVEENKVVDQFQTLINPYTFLPPQISQITGITSQELETAPTFYEVKSRILELLSDCYFVAHNVRFDYGFLKNEFKRHETSFNSKHFCTVKLSRNLYPEHVRHNLDSIIERFQFVCEKRHRAFDDATILWKFWDHIQKEFHTDIINQAVEKTMKKPSLPIHLSPDILDTLPESPGVYIFYGEEKVPLYIGKSINIKDRILSHFSSDHSSSTEMKISQQIRSIETIETAGEFGALIKESMLIKKLAPLYNRMLRMKRKLVILKKTQDKNGFDSVEMRTVDHIPVTEFESVMGVFRSQRHAKQFLILLVERYQLCEKILGLEKTSSACFGYRLSRCKGGCVNEEKPISYNMRFIEAFSKHKIKPWPFKEAVVIEEQNPLSSKTDRFVIDKWCFIKSVSQDGEFGINETENEISFDLDTYKILLSYLRTGKNLKKIKRNKKEEASLAGFASF